MTYVFPPSLHPLRDYLRSVGADTIAFVSARQAAFMAQQLLGTRVKFPSKGDDMTSTLFLIQKAVTEKGMVMTPTPSREQRSKAITAAADQLLRDAKGQKPNKAKKPKSPWANLKRNRPDFGPHVFAEGIHIFADGAAVPNPGAGGWGVAVYRAGIEIDSRCGGDLEATNNRMEMTALLVAIEMASEIPEFPGLTIWCDSQYCVEGVNTWMPTWKARGWNKRKLNSPKRDDGGIKNLELWQAIDRALEDALKIQGISIRWVKGHVGIVGNERADELAEIGRQSVIPEQNIPADDLDAQYRAIMGAA